MKAFFDWKMEREVALEACPKDLLERGNLKDLVRSLQQKREMIQETTTHQQQFLDCAHLCKGNGQAALPCPIFGCVHFYLSYQEMPLQKISSSMSDLF